MQVSQDTKRELVSRGAALGATWGGPQQQRYYTPSGDVVYAIPAIRDWVEKDDAGKVLRTGERDANLDKGWTLYMPPVLKLHCQGCDRWHDTEEEVATCLLVRHQKALAGETLAKRMMGEQESGSSEPAMVALEAKVDRLADLVAQLLEAE